jgi:hypothetical protein
MFKERVIITKLSITKVGQIVHFQVKIPRDAIRIIGVELSGCYSNPPMERQAAFAKLALATEARMSRSFSILQFTSSPFVGDVRLQSCEDTNVFYSDDVYLADYNLGYGDFSATALFPATSETHGYKRYEYVVNTNGETTILKGIYRDRQTANSNPQYTYTVNVYVWYEKICKEA